MVQLLLGFRRFAYSTLGFNVRRRWRQEGSRGLPLSRAKEKAATFSHRLQPRTANDERRTIDELLDLQLKGHHQHRLAVLHLIEKRSVAEHAAHIRR